MSRPLVVAVFVCACALACVGPGGGGIVGPVDPARGERYFKAKCNACHPGGAKGAGPALLGKTLPGPLRMNDASVGHSVSAVEYESLLTYLTVLTHPPAAEPAPPPAPDSGTQRTPKKAAAITLAAALRQGVATHYADPHRAMDSLVRALLRAGVGGAPDEVLSKVQELGVEPPQGPDEVRAMVRALLPLLAA